MDFLEPDDLGTTHEIDDTADTVDRQQDLEGAPDPHSMCSPTFPSPLSQFTDFGQPFQRGRESYGLQPSICNQYVGNCYVQPAGGQSFQVSQDNATSGDSCAQTSEEHSDQGSQNSYNGGNVHEPGAQARSNDTHQRAYSSLQSNQLILANQIGGPGNTVRRRPVQPNVQVGPLPARCEGNATGQSGLPMQSSQGAQDGPSLSERPNIFGALSSFQQDNTFSQSFEGQFLKGAKNFAIKNSNLINTNVHESHYHLSLPGFTSLHQQVSHKATFDSAERYTAGRCHPGTRETIIKQIVQWTLEHEPDSDIIWLHGSAGVGKSSIAQSIAEKLFNKYRHLFAGSFFFAAGVAGRDKGHLLFSSLAYQIGVNIPGMKNLIDEAMNKDLSLPTKTMNIQLQSLLIEPFQSASSDMKQPIRTAIIDGLDECEDQDVQSEILFLIANALHKSRIPLRFLIASRPESWIRGAFSRHPLLSLTKPVSPREGGDSDRDIEKFLRDSFKDIAQRNSKLMAIVNGPWPSDEVICQFVDEASGQFIYASTVVKFVAAPRHNPLKQLNILLTPGPSRNTAFTDLDHLYRKILSLCPDQELMKTVLAGIMLDLSPRAIQILFDVDYADVLVVLNCLSSIVEVLEPSDYETDEEELEIVFGPPDSQVRVNFYHRSITEFLKDKTRSGFSIDPQEYGNQITYNLFNAVIDSLRGVYAHEKYPDIPSPLYHSIIDVSLSAGRLRWFDCDVKINLYSKLSQRLEDLLGMDVLPLNQPENILQYIRHIGNILEYNKCSCHPNMLSPSSSEKVAAKIVEQLLSSQYLQITSSTIPALLFSYSSSLYLNQLSAITRLPTSSIKETLVSHSSLIAINFETSLSHRRFYSLGFANIIHTALIGINHTEYRHMIFSISHYCSRLLHTSRKAYTWGQYSYSMRILSKLLVEPLLSDIRGKEDLEVPHFKHLAQVILDPKWGGRTAFQGAMCEASIDDDIFIWSSRQIVNSVGEGDSSGGLKPSHLRNTGLWDKLWIPFCTIADREFPRPWRVLPNWSSSTWFEVKESEEKESLCHYLSNVTASQTKPCLCVADGGVHGCRLLTWGLLCVFNSISATMGQLVGSRTGVNSQKCLIFNPNLGDPGQKKRIEQVFLSALFLRCLHRVYVTESILGPIRDICSLSLQRKINLFLPHGSRSQLSTYLKRFTTDTLPEEELERLNMWLRTRVFEEDDLRVTKANNSGEEDNKDDEDSESQEESDSRVTVEPGEEGGNFQVILDASDNDFTNDGTSKSGDEGGFISGDNEGVYGAAGTGMSGMFGGTSDMGIRGKKRKIVKVNQEVDNDQDNDTQLPTTAQEGSPAIKKTKVQ